jgi:hypothetical protein
MPDQRKPTSDTPFQPGDLVSIKGYERLLGRIVEFRGPLGPNGELIYGIDLQTRPVVSYIELREDQIEHAPTPVRVSRVKSPKVSAKGPKANRRARPR